MSEQMNPTQVRAEVAQEATVNLKITVQGRTYVFMIPAGSPYEEAYVIALEMGGLVKQMQEQVKQAAETKPDEVKDGAQ